MLEVSDHFNNAPGLLSNVVKHASHFTKRVVDNGCVVVKRRQPISTKIVHAAVIGVLLAIRMDKDDPARLRTRTSQTMNAGVVFHALYGSTPR